MLGQVKNIWKIGMAVGGAILAGSVGGAVYDTCQAKKSIALLDDDDDFDDIVEEDDPATAEG